MKMKGPLAFGSLVVGACGGLLIASCSSFAGPTASDVTDAGDASADVVSAPGTDAGSADADASPFCARTTGAAYCEDFDTNDDVSLLEPESSSLMFPFTLTRETFRSPPRSLVMTIPKDAPEGSYLVFKRSFDGKKTIRVELDWNFAIAPEVGGTLQAITLKRAAPQVAFGRTCGVSDSGVGCSWYVARCVTSFSPCDETTPIPSPPFVGKWARVFLEARLEREGHVSFGVVGSPPLYEADVTGATEEVDPADPTTVTIGLANLQGSSPGLSMFVDSVAVYEK